MKRLTLLLFVVATTLLAQDAIKLPAPKKSGGMPLADALSNRKTTRSFQSTDLDMQTLSNLLWAAYGVNREDGKRTAPTARGSYSSTIWLVTKDNVYVYNAQDNSLEHKLSGDYRQFTGVQDFVKDVPLNIVFVADMDKVSFAKSEIDRIKYAAVDAAFIAQNVYLFCAANNLGTVVRGSFDAKMLGEKLKLKSNELVVWTQSVGFCK